MEKMSDFIFKFNLSGSGLAKSFFKIVDFLLQFDDLVLLFVKDSGVVEDSVGLASGHVVDFTFQQSLDFGFEQKQALFELRLFLAGEHCFFGTEIELVDHGQEDVLESSKSVKIRFGREDSFGILFPSDGRVSGLSFRDSALTGGCVLDGGFEFVLAN